MIEFRLLYEYSDNQLIEHLQERGYVVRHRSEARHQLYWNRVHPFPRGTDFKQEALEKIRGQITVEHLRFVDRPTISLNGDTGLISSALLYVLEYP